MESGHYDTDIEDSFGVDMPNLLFSCFGRRSRVLCSIVAYMYVYMYTVTLAYLETLPHVKISLTNMCLYPVKIYSRPTVVIHYE